MSGHTPAPISQRSEFQQLADQMDGVAIWIATELGTFDYVSEGFEAIWGVPADAVEDDIDRMFEGVHPDDRDQMLSAVDRAAGELADASFEHRVVRPDGTVR